ncbi:MAG TPA: MFS transporter [Candidatus Baltobacteraceae bacterium]|jgi:FSR family fosmidomycin resistance protein-like MFS transporter
MATIALPLDRRGVSTLSVAHVFNDLNQSAIPAMLPFLVAKEHVSLAAAASLILAMNLSSSVVQPLFGYISDRRSLAWVIPVAVLVAAAGTSAIGLVHSMTGMFVGAMIAGVGVAAFHPEGSRYANYCSRGQRATGMGWFSLGGYGGFALGPILVTPMLLAFGLRGTAFLIVPGIAAAALMWSELGRFKHFRKHAFARVKSGAPQPDDWRGFGWLTAVVSLRSVAFFGAVAFLPLLFIRVLHASASQGNLALSLMLLAGALGTVTGGRMADRYARHTIVTFSIASIALLTAALAIAGSLHAPQVLVVALAVMLGFGMALSASVLVVLGQEYLPNRIGVASGVTLGLAVSVGGIGAPIFGAIGDRFGLIAVFTAIATVAAVSCLGSLTLHSMKFSHPAVRQARGDD